MPQQPPFAPQSEYNTQLPFGDELQFRQWLQDNSVPFNPEAGVSDYDMRGFYRAMQSGNPLARSSVDPYDQRLHYPDYWKTPLHDTFSSESQWAQPGAPQWINGAQLASPSGRVLFDASQPRGRIAAALAGYK